MASSPLPPGKLFRSKREFDGIPRSPGALTLETTYQAFYGRPDVYVTCLYRWPDNPVAEFMSGRAAELGNRFGRNKLIIPACGREEEFWHDGSLFLGGLTVAGARGSLDDMAAYLIVSAVEPDLLPTQSHPFLLWTIGEVRPVQLIAFFSKLLDLFHVEIGSFESFRGRLRPSPGRCLLAGQGAPEDPEVRLALDRLAEICTVLTELSLTFHCFPWTVTEAFAATRSMISSDLARSSTLNRVRQHLSSDHAITQRPGKAAPIFLSYRRQDSQDATDRITEHLARHFGRDRVFRDIGSIPGGVDFPDVLREALAACRVFIPVIGRGWASCVDAAGRRRLDDEGDFVRIEVATALARGVCVLPLLINGGAMPRDEELPPPLKRLVYYNALRVRSDPDFVRDIAYVVKEIRERL